MLVLTSSEWLQRMKPDYQGYSIQTSTQYFQNRFLHLNSKGDFIALV